MMPALCAALPVTSGPPGPYASIWPRPCLATRILGNTTAAEDVAQEAFIRVWNAAEWEDFETRWRAVLDLALSHRPQSLPTKTQSRTVGIDPADDRLIAEDKLQQFEQSGRELGAALQQLPERQRAAFVLCFYEEHPIRKRPIFWHQRQGD